jgi:short-subunit dehydrogenase
MTSGHHGGYGMSERVWAVVTGASSGLGVEFARSLARRKINVVLVARREAPMQQLADELRLTHGVEIVVESMDLAEATSAEGLPNSLDRRGIRPEILVNNAAFGLSGEFLEQDAARIHQMLQLDVLALVSLTHVFGEMMKELGRGHILLVGSLAAYQPTPLMAAYGAAKNFVLAFGEALHVELAPTVVSPGLMETEFFGVAGYTPKESLKSSMMTAKDVAEAGIVAMYAGKSSVVIGRLNKLAVFSTRFFSRNVQAKIVYRMSRE